MERFARKGHWSEFFFKTWRPVATSLQTIIIFVCLGIFFLILSIVLFVSNAKIKETKIRYDNRASCNKLGYECVLEFQIDQTIEPPIFVYYQLDNFLQNHRRYIKSRSNKQLAGEEVDANTAAIDCDPAVRNIDVVPQAIREQLKLVDNDTAWPCGLIAKTFFNDTFLIDKVATNEVIDKVVINETGIAWPGDLGTKFKNGNLKKQWIDMEKNEHFAVWMRISGLQDFQKLWGRIDKKLESGKYVLRIKNNYDVSGFKGSKYFIITNTNGFGGKNPFLAVAYIITCIICFGIALLFAIKRKSSAGLFGGPPNKRD